MPLVTRTFYLRRQAALIRSTESSNRIEGITVPLSRLKELVAEKTSPRDRSEQEIAGYRDVLNTIHTSYAHIPVIISGIVGLLFYEVLS